MAPRFDVGRIQRVNILNHVAANAFPRADSLLPPHHVNPLEGDGTGYIRYVSVTVTQ